MKKPYEETEQSDDAAGRTDEAQDPSIGKSS